MSFNRIFISILLLIFSFQNFTKADDLGDFEIEGISIGDSLLKFANRERIISSISKSKYDNDKYIIYEVDKLIDLEIYDFLGVTTKKNDEKFIVTSLSGNIIYDDLDECYKIRDEIKEYIESIFVFDALDKTEYKSKTDKTGNSKIYGMQFYLKPYPSVEAIVLNCNDNSKESGFHKVLTVNINPEEFAYFLINEAYK